MTYGSVTYGDLIFGGGFQEAGGASRTVEEIIETALFRHMAAMVFEPAVPVAWPNRVFQSSADVTWLRINHIRNDNERLFLKGSNPHRRQGILQITVVTPLTLGPNGGTTLAGNVALHWPAGAKLYSEGIRIEVERAPDVYGPIPTDAAWETPVSVRYRSFC